MSGILCWQSASTWFCRHLLPPPGLLLALLIGLASVGRPRIYSVAITVANLIFVIPSLAMFALLIPLVGLGFKPAFISLSAYSLLIILRNVWTGLRSTPTDVLEAADGMGYSRRQRLIRIELPLALPLILSGNSPRPCDVDRDCNGGRLHRRRRSWNHHSDRGQSRASGENPRRIIGDRGSRVHLRCFAALGRALSSAVEMT